MNSVSRAFRKFLKPGKSVDDLRVDVEEARLDEFDLLLGQVGGRNLGQCPIDVLGSIGQFLDLQEEDRESG